MLLPPLTLTVTLPYLNIPRLSTQMLPVPSQMAMAAKRLSRNHSRKSSYALDSDHVQQAPPSQRRGANGLLSEPRVLPPPPNPGPVAYNKP